MTSFIKMLAYSIIIASLISVIAVEIVYCEDQDTMKVYRFSGISVIGSETKLLEDIPGTAHIIGETELRLMKASTVSEALAGTSGINIADEEGQGLRLNLSIRGLDPDRSRSLLIMEDGMPLALAPYGEPEMYYTPSIDRMGSVEIIKGSGSILYGPQTIGGVVNFLSRDAPLNGTFNFDLTGGNGAYLKGKFGYGVSGKNFGMFTEFLRKSGEDIGNLDFTVNDFMGKFKFVLDNKSSLNVKIGVYDESSNSTYIGITQAMYDKGQYFEDIAPNDNLDIRRYSASLSHNYVISQNIFINTLVYGYTTSRNWLRQDFARTNANNVTMIFGDTTIAGGALYMKNSTGQRNRQFEVLGAESRITSEFSALGLKNEIKAGLRYLEERAFEQFVAGTKDIALSGQLRDNEIRTGKAFSAYLQDRIYLNDNIIITPGFRFEHFDYKRNIIRAKSIDTNIQATSNVVGLIPGLGLNYNITETITIFSGIHKGFAPPRTKDAITSEGEPLDLDAESSWNSELGVRSRLSNMIDLELTFYLLDFSNQVIPVSMSSGGTGTGLVNGGKTLHKGIELSLGLDIGELLSINTPMRLMSNISINESKYSSDRYINFANDKVNIKGFTLPYAPTFKWNSKLYIITDLGIELSIAANLTGSQFTDELNTTNPSADGQIGVIDAHAIFDATVHYQLPDSSLALFLSIKNLTDERYISSRRPQGIKVGLPRMVMAGIDFSF